MIIKKIRGFVAIIAIFTSSTIPALAAPITLDSHDGSAKITGELVSFSDGFYTVSTPLGDVRMDASRTTCAGESCPVLIATTESVPES